MEQKQLDEIDESYFGEEFIDDFSVEEGIKVEPVKPVKDTKPKKEKKTTRKMRTTKTSKVKEEPVEVEEIEEIEEVEKVEELEEPIEIKEASVEEIAEPIKEEAPKEEFKVVKEDIKPTKEETPVETSPTIDPWAEESEDGAGLFKEISTWKAIAGIVVILLIFSVFTQGFQFSENTMTGAAGLSLLDAEDKALNFVNGNLLQPPFVAELVASEEIGGLYKITLSVAGQPVDSYLTKDGELFFPQGFDTSLDLSALEGAELEELEEVVAEETELVIEEEPVVEEEVVPEEVEIPIGEEIVEETPVEEEIPVEEEPVVEEVVPEPVVESGKTVEVPMLAKKWLFSPDNIKVSVGDKVVLRVSPKDLDFTFSVPAFGVEQNVAGATTVEFVASEAGTFDFKCGSCEDWRGMAGTLVVE